MHALKKHRPLRRVTLAAATTVTGFVLLLSLKPHTAPTVAQASSSAGQSQSPSRSPSSGSTSGSSSAGSSGSTRSTGTKTVTGDTIQTRWGPVQVRVTLKNGKITDVTAVSYPSDNPRDQEINSYALPQLRREALAAQSAQIDSVSGATYTSDGYQQSLQSALDSAGL
ncbi:FMN-binding protein [Streptomyces olivochromogenes]|uniref:FMN-binding protein n=1 Tax=Streptomyces olivochromogenes TaxID=1963 RepID=A0A250VFQ0_STROL|nr:FMN-binding protein [Streptomyces olivochromogenes]KUN47503.1 FMN-binding protein [Streptomyces olivochromogenes]GAX52929.1 FMN-binding protein [Streptomyces olivochromogenes]